MSKESNLNTTTPDYINDLQDEPMTLCNRIIELALDEGFSVKLEDDNSYESKIFNLAVKYLDKKDEEPKEKVLEELLANIK